MKPTCFYWIYLGDWTCPLATMTPVGFDLDFHLNVSKNSPQEPTAKAVIDLAKSCPNLRFVLLYGTSGLQNITLEALFDSSTDLFRIHYA